MALMLLFSILYAGLFPALWLLLCRAIPPLWRRPALSFGVAALMAVVAAFLRYGGPTPLSLLGSALALLLIYFGYRQVRR